MLEVNCSAFFIFTEINMIIERRVDLICYMWNTPTPNQNEKGTFQLFHLHAPTIHDFIFKHLPMD